MHDDHHPNKLRPRYKHQRRQGAKETAGEGVPGVEYSGSRCICVSNPRYVFFITLSTLLNIHSTLDYVFGMKNPNEQPLPSYHEHQHGNTLLTPGFHIMIKATSHSGTSMDGEVDGCRAIQRGNKKGPRDQDNVSRAVCTLF